MSELIFKVLVVETIETIGIVLFDLRSTRKIPAGGEAVGVGGIGGGDGFRVMFVPRRDPRVFILL